MADGLRYDRQTVGRPSSLAAQKAAKQKKSSWYDKPGEWLEAGIEAANEGMRINDFGEWAKELPVELTYRKPREFIVDPLVRTFTGQEARQNYLNPEGGLRLPERALGVASDALNVASVAPGMKAVLAAPQGALKSALARMAGRRAAPVPVKEFSERAAAKAAAAGHRQSQASADVFALSEHSKTGSYPAYGEYSKLPFPEEGTIRLWHTNPEGAALPKRLLSTRESARIPERRDGSGGTQLLHGGIYTTESRPLSGTYFTGSNQPQMRTAQTGPIIPSFLEEKLSTFPQTIDNYPVPRHIASEISRKKSRALLDQAIDVKTPVNAAQRSALLDEYFKLDGVDISDAVQKEFDAAETWEDLLNISSVPESLKRQWQTAITKAASPSGEGSVPLVFKSDTPVMYRGELVDRFHPYYVFGDEPVKIANQAEQAAYNYSRDVIQQHQGIYEQQVRDLIERIVREGPGSSQAAAARLREIMRMRQETIDYASSDVLNPFMKPSVVNDTEVMGGQIGGYWTPGQNYWDLPIERSGIAGNTVGDIQSIGGQRAFDLSYFTPQKIEELSQAVEAFFVSKGFVDQELSDVIREYSKFLNNPEINSAQALEGFRSFIDTSANVAHQAGITSDRTIREDLYDFIADYLDINAMPHPGGATTGSARHQAVAFARPELLPPSQYALPGEEAFEEALRRYNLERTKRFYADRVNVGVGRPWQIAPQASQAPIDLSKMLALNMAARPGLNNRKTGTPVR